MKKRNRFRSVYFAGTSSISFFLYFACPSIAGEGLKGSLPSNFVPQTDTDLTVEQIEMRKRINSFSWKSWSMPYTDGDLICRQNQGDIVCFSSNTSSQLNWKIHSTQVTSP
jgi:hypothetical protein